MNASTILHTLWSATDAKNLSDAQLETLSCNDGLSNGLSNVAEIMMSVGCLVADEGNRGERSGNFQEPASIANLLWVLSDVIDTAAAASFVANDAKAVLHHRALSLANVRNKNREVSA